MFSPLSKIHDLDWFMCFLTRVSTSLQKIQMLRARFKNCISIKKWFLRGKQMCSTFRSTTNGTARSLSPWGFPNLCWRQTNREQARHCLSKVINQSIILDNAQDNISADEYTFLMFLESVARIVPLRLNLCLHPAE